MVNKIKLFARHIEDIIVVPFGGGGHPIEDNDHYVTKFFSFELMVLSAWLIFGVMTLLVSPMVLIMGIGSQLMSFLSDPNFTHHSGMENMQHYIVLILFFVVPFNFFCYGVLRWLGNSIVTKEQFEWMRRNYGEIGMEAPHRDMTKRDLCRYVERAMSLRNERLDDAKTYLS